MIHILYLIIIGVLLVIYGLEIERRRKAESEASKSKNELRKLQARYPFK